MTDRLEHHRLRSQFIRTLVQRPVEQLPIRERYVHGTPKTIVQFWHDLQQLPQDVADCIDSWAGWTTRGFTHRLYDEQRAKEFIASSLDARHEYAFERCYHPAMQADYFRLCYLFVEGGFYVDADDVCVGSDIGWLFDDGRLKIQPLCYDVASAAMVPTSVFLQRHAYSPNWIFYFNNNPLVARRQHPIIERALNHATDLLEAYSDGVLPEIQSTTGPGNLSKSIFEAGNSPGGVTNDLVVLHDWNAVAISKWPLSYRDDARNWRLSNQLEFRRSDLA